MGLQMLDHQGKGIVRVPQGLEDSPANLRENPSKGGIA
jgi:hypothetical protein